MSQLYARVFVQILDSSIAEDFTLRHVFEDFLKLCDYQNGVVDMTRQALSRRLNIPLKLLNESIEKLESPDPSSRDSDYEGRRIERLDDHRDWGWKILNWEKYDRIRVRAAGAERAARYRDKKKEENVNDTSITEKVESPTIEIPPPLNTEQFHKLWEEWLTHLKEKKKKPGPTAVRKQLSKLEGMGLERSLAALTHSIAGNYQGIYEPNENRTSTNRSPNHPKAPLVGSVPNNGF